MAWNPEEDRMIERIDQQRQQERQERQQQEDRAQKSADEARRIEKMEKEWGVTIHATALQRASLWCLVTVLVLIGGWLFYRQRADPSLADLRAALNALHLGR